jgi:hypothetical protein
MDYAASASFSFDPISIGHPAMGEAAAVMSRLSPRSLLIGFRLHRRFPQAVTASLLS